MIRESNLELLRIVSMLFVVLVHLDGGCLGIPDLEGDWTQMDTRVIWRMSVEAFTFIGVNCFTLISGYFGVRLRLKGAVGFLFQCLFYSVGLYVVMCAVGRTEFSWSVLTEHCLVLTHTDLWYVPAYFMLMLLSPFLNAGFERLSRRESLNFTLIFVAFNFWCGWWWGGKFNPSGYTPVQLVMMYCLGRILREYKDSLLRITRHPVFIWGMVYLCATLVTIVMGVYDFRHAYSYNQPFVVLASIAFFLFFLSMRFTSGAVNYAAKSAFAVYLLHKSPLIWGGILRPGVIRLWQESTLAAFTLYALLLTIGIYIAAMVIDPFRRNLYSQLLLSVKNF